MPSTPLLILGAGDLSVEVASFIEAESIYRIAGFVEGRDRDICGEDAAGRKVFWIEDIAAMASSHLAIAAIGDPARKRLIERAGELGFSFATYVHPRAVVPACATVGEGSIVGPGVVLAAQTVIGPHVYLNRNASIGHHSGIGAYSTIGPGATIGGRCNIGHSVVIGIGATVIDRIELAADSFVAAGAVVTKSFGKQVRLAGVPARVIASR